MKHRVALSGRSPATPEAATPTDETLADGQKADHWVLPPEERAKGYLRPVRTAYKHVGAAGPTHPVRHLTEGEKALYADEGYVQYELYPPDEAITGRYWSAAALARVGAGCGTVTTMPPAIAETYARQPRYYGSTFCCGCREYLPVGPDGEFTWDGTTEMVGT